MSADICWLERCGSTNSELSRRAADMPHGYVVAARVQDAGRGQRGNSWEAEPYKNLTFSILLRPDNMAAARQFELSMLVALAVADTVDSIAGAGTSAVKWPNDIYIGDKKLAGILIENSLCGNLLAHAIAGIGININQTVFLSDAPNPVSLSQVTGASYDLDSLMRRFADAVAEAVSRYDGDSAALVGKYRRKLYRGTGEHPFREPGGTTFKASITDISPAGPITLSNGKTYYFKEIEFVNAN